GLRVLAAVLHAPAWWDVIAQYYRWLALALLGGMSVLLLVRRYELWQTLMVLVCAACLVPSISYQYKAILFLVPLGLFVAAAAQKRSSVLVCILVGLLWIPKEYAWVHYDVSLASFVNPLLIAVLAATVRAIQPTKGDQAAAV
ncbi:MAG TPA: hypothetical protein VF551_02930, partial [Chthoniobacterales bacterium]